MREHVPGRGDVVQRALGAPPDAGRDDDGAQARERDADDQPRHQHRAAQHAGRGRVLRGHGTAG